jgi:hypothetical protein
VVNYLRFRPAATARRRGALALLLATIAALCAFAAPAGAVKAGEFGVQRRGQVTINEKKPLQYHGGPVLHSSVSYAIYWDPTGSYNSEWKQLIDGYLQSVGAEKGTLGNVFALNGQYRDGSGRAANEAIFRGAYTDETPYPTSGNCSDKPTGTISCLTDAQVRAELLHVIGSGALPGATGTPVYYILTPPGVVVCTDGGGTGNCSDSTTTSPTNGICGYHSAISPGGPSPTVYAVQPWVAGNAGQVINPAVSNATNSAGEDVLACQDNRELNEPNQLGSHNIFGEWTEGLAEVIINDLSIEQSNVVTDPLLNGWYQNTSNAEQSDMCQWVFGPPPNPLPKPSPEQEPAHAQMWGDEMIGLRHYYMQYAFDSVGVTAGKGRTCWSGVALEAHYTAPNPVNAGDVVAFDATESNITLNAHTAGLGSEEPFVAPVYAWDFGDGATVAGTNTASEFHSYQYGGIYNVALTVTDSSGNSNTFTKAITVVGPARPGSGASTTSGSATPGSSLTAVPIVKPVATTALPSRSLRKALHGGLVVRYAVNEQVAGHFEVFLGRTLARHLGITGPAAIGLPAGSAAQIVIAKAILVTTAGGRGTIKLQFSKRTAKRLARMSKVTLTMRLVVRNAAHTPASTTVLSSFTLTH